MRKASSPWNRLFLFCFGLALGTSFCMKWMESDLRVSKLQRFNWWTHGIIPANLRMHFLLHPLRRFS